MSPVVPVAALTDRSQRFACVPLRAVMSAAACLGRRSALDISGAPTHRACAICALGAAVEERLGSTPATRDSHKARAERVHRARAAATTAALDIARSARIRQRQDLLARQGPCAVPGCVHLRWPPDRPWRHEVQIAALCLQHRVLVSAAARAGDDPGAVVARLMRREP